MITFLIKLLTVILLLLSLLIALVGGLYVLSTELQWLLDVDILHKAKMKVRAIVYAETKRERETVGRLFRSRKGRGKSDRTKLQSIKKRLFRSKYKSKTVSKQTNKVVKQVVKSWRKVPRGNLWT